MNFLRQLTISIGSSFDRVMSQIENHEALVASALKEMQKGRAKAKVQLQRVRRDGEQMKMRVSELQEADIRWKERALRVREEDEKKAIECLRRRKQVQRELESLEGQYREHEKFEQQLTLDMKTIDARISELQRKKNELSARQTRTQALNGSAQVDNLGMITEVSDIFDRWEVKIGENEIGCENKDSFEDDFISEEEEKDLVAELNCLADTENS